MSNQEINNKCRQTQNKPLISVGIVNFNGLETLDSTIKSLISSDYANMEILLVDDGSTDSSLKHVEKYYPNVKIYPINQNTKNPNILRNIILTKASSDYVLITDNDIDFEKTCISTLYNVLTTVPNAVLCTPRLFYDSDKSKIYSDGGSVHYLATSIDINRGQEIGNDWDNSPRDTVGGGILLLDRSKITSEDYFDEDYYRGWGEDGHIYQILILQGFRTLHVPKAIAYHRAKEWNSDRHFRALGQVRNRWHVLLTTYATRSLILFSPMLLIFEFFLITFFSFKKMPHMYFKGIWIAIIDIRKILKKRASIQNKRRVSDLKVIACGDLYVSPVLIQKPIFKFCLFFLNMLFKLYWKFIFRFI